MREEIKSVEFSPLILAAAVSAHPPVGNSRSPLSGRNALYAHRPRSTDLFSPELPAWRGSDVLCYRRFEKKTWPHRSYFIRSLQNRNEKKVFIS